MTPAEGSDTLPAPDSPRPAEDQASARADAARFFSPLPEPSPGADADPSTGLPPTRVLTDEPPPDPNLGAGSDTRSVAPPTRAAAEEPQVARFGAPAVPTVPGYEIESVLGRGGMGVVYKARQVKANRTVALKMILSGTYASHAERHRFQAEAEAVARLGHPNIVQVFEVGEHDRLPFFSLEFCPGGSLDRQLADSPLPPPAAARMAVALALGVQAAHEKNVIHRDLKPANVLLAADGTPKITDFGLAKQLDAEGAPRTRTGVIMGTPGYMAPEQAAGRTREVGPLADVYSLGAILYELLTGQPPFKGASVMDVLERVRTQDPIPPSRLTRKLPRELETICLKCLQKEPGKRYGSARELADDLRRYLNHEPILARPASTGERLVKWARRRPAQAVAAALLLVSVLATAAGAVFYARSKEKEAEALGERAERSRLEAKAERERAEQEASARRQRDKVVNYWLDGQKAESRGDFDSASKSYNQALPLASDAEWRSRLEKAAAGVQKKREELDARRKGAAETGKLVQSVERFRRHGDEVIFHSISFRKEDEAENNAIVRRRASQALAELDLTYDRLDTLPAALRRWQDLLKDSTPAVALECAEVLLTWADADPPRARQLREGAERLLKDGARPAAATALRTARVRLKSALDNYLKGQIPAAVASCEEVLATQPRDFRAQYLKALCNLRDRRWDLARVGLTACLGQRKDHPALLLLLGTAHSGQAVALADRKDPAAQKEFTAAEDAFQRAWDGDDRPAFRAAVLTNRSWIRLQQERWDDAHRDLTRAITLQPKAYQGYVNRAQAYADRGDLDEAVADLDKAIELNPDAALYYRRARLQIERGEPGLARKDFGKVVDLLKPETRSVRLAGAHVGLAAFDHRARAYDAALGHCKKALEVLPDFAAAYRQQAETLLAQGHKAEAAQALDRYLKLEGGNYRELEQRKLTSRRARQERDRMRQTLALAYKARGILHAEHREYGLAIRAYGASIDLEEDPGTLALRGWEYLRLGSPALALPDFKRAVPRAPQSVEALCGRGLSHVQFIRPEKKENFEVAVTREVRESIRDADEAERRARQEGSFAEDALRRLLLNCARTHAHAVGVLEAVGDRPLNNGLASRCQERALRLLDQSMALVPPREKRTYWRREVRSDPAFQPLRTSGGMFRREQIYGR